MHSPDRPPKQDPQKPDHQPGKINPPGFDEPSDKPRPQPNPKDQPFAKCIQ